MSMGMDFTCGNKACQNFDTCLTLHGPWPIAEVDDIMKSDFPFKEAFREGMEKRISEGRTHACIPLPNNDAIPVKGMRVQAYCPKCVVVWDEDILRSDCVSEESFCFAVGAMQYEPPACRCGSTRMTVDSIGKGSLQCPACGVPMERQGWVVKATKAGKSK